MTVRVEITQDTATPAVASALQGLQGDAMRLMLGDIGEYLLHATRERAKRQVAPDGTTWQALSPRYLAYKNKKRPGLPILKFDNHMLGDQLSWQVENGDTLAVGTNAQYGAAHQFGATIKIFARSQQAYFNVDKHGVFKPRFVKKNKSNFAQYVTLPEHDINIPARPWLGVSAEDETEIANIASDHLRDVFGLRA